MLGSMQWNARFLGRETLKAPFSFETDVLAPHVKEINPVAFACDGRFLDIGVPEDLDRAQVELSFVP